MQVPLDVTYRNRYRDEQVARRINSQVMKLEAFHDAIISCHVVVEAPHHRHRKGERYHVGIRLTVPHREITVGREEHEHHAQEDVHVAVHDTFKIVRRQLQEHFRELRGRTRQPRAAITGTDHVIV